MKKAVKDRTTQYALDVLAGRIVAGELVRMACQRHLDDLERAKLAPFRYYFDVEAANDTGVCGNPHNSRGRGTAARPPLSVPVLYTGQPQRLEDQRQGPPTL